MSDLVIGILAGAGVFALTSVLILAAVLAERRRLNVRGFFIRFTRVLPRALLIAAVIYSGAWYLVLRDTYQEVSVPKTIYEFAVVHGRSGPTEGEIPPHCDWLQSWWRLWFEHEDGGSLSGEAWNTVRCKESMVDRVKHWAPW